MISPQKFWDKAAPSYARSPVRDEKSYQKKLAITQEYFRPDWSVPLNQQRVEVTYLDFSSLIHSVPLGCITSRGRSVRRGFFAVCVAVPIQPRFRAAEQVAALVGFFVVEANGIANEVDLRPAFGKVDVEGDDGAAIWRAGIEACAGGGGAEP